MHDLSRFDVNRNASFINTWFFEDMTYSPTHINTELLIPSFIEKLSQWFST